MVLKCSCNKKQKPSIVFLIEVGKLSKEEAENNIKEMLKKYKK